MKTKNSIECWVFDFALKRILLLKCPKTDRHDEYWQPVTGGVEKDEDKVYACIREVKEETGIELKPADLVKLIDNFTFCIPDEKIELQKPVFIAQVKKAEVVISDEHTGYKWVEPEAVPGYLLWESNMETFKSVFAFLDTI